MKKQPYTRLRTRGVLTPDTGYYERNYEGLGPYETGPKTFFAPVGTTESMRDTVNPGFAEARKQGAVSFNAMQRIVATTVRSAGSEVLVGQPMDMYDGSKRRPRVVWHGNVHELITPLANGTIPPLLRAISDDDIESARKEVSTKVLSDRGRGNANLWETLAEADKSLKLVSQNLETIRKMINPRGRTVFHKDIARARGSADIYLSARYGVMPLIRDTQHVIEGLGQDVEEKVRETSRGSVTLTGTKSQLYTQYTNTQFRAARHDFTDVVRIRGMSLDEYIATLGSNIGFRTKGLITLPWELLSYSFVYDWIVNIGDRIGSIVPAVGFNHLGSCLTIEREQTLSHTPTESVGLNGWTCSEFSGTMFHSQIVKTRVPNLDSPSLVVRSDFRFTNLTRALDAAALLLQKVRIR